jgi:polyadenylate-binding protein
MTDDEVKEMFKPFGHIASMVLSQNPNVKGVKFGFVCYSDPNVVDGTVQPADKAYGPKCAQAAIEGLHGRKMDDNLQLYVRAAMNKEDRQNEKVRETLRYKQSKKRCNLYVKNFPGDWNEDKLKELFEQFGETEKGGIKIQKPNSNNVFAFVCFKTPDSAAMAKQTLHNHNIDGKTLMINHYEIKEFRDLQKEEAMDK